LLKFFCFHISFSDIRINKSFRKKKFSCPKKKIQSLLFIRNFAHTLKRRGKKEKKKRKQMVNYADELFGVGLGGEFGEVAGRTAPLRAFLYKPKAPRVTEPINPR